MSITYAQFVAEWNERYNDAIHDPYSNQCMDLVAQYADELGLPRFWGNAADVAVQYPAGWPHVSVPIQGDVLVFARNTYNGNNGHIGIFDRPGYLFSENYYPDKRCVVQPILPNDQIIAILRPSTLGGSMNQDDLVENIYYRIWGVGADDNAKKTFASSTPAQIVDALFASPTYIELAKQALSVGRSTPATDAEAQSYRASRVTIPDIYKLQAKALATRPESSDADKKLQQIKQIVG